MKTYTSYERANFAYRWCYPDVNFMPCPYDEDDTDIQCEAHVLEYLKHIRQMSNAHPIKRKYHTVARIVSAFNKEFPQTP